MDQETLGAALALAKKNAVSESVIQNKVEGWLNAHPEKTTTVQDGAISYSKLDASLKEKADDVSQLKNAIEYKQVYLFGLNNNGVFAQSGYGCRIYSIKFLNGEIIIANFIPCIRKSDNKPGMYDTVSKTFFTNAGTDEFIVPE